MRNLLAQNTSPIVQLLTQIMSRIHTFQYTPDPKSLEKTFYHPQPTPPQQEEQGKGKEITKTSIYLFPHSSHLP